MSDLIVKAIAQILSPTVFSCWFRPTKKDGGIRSGFSTPHSTQWSSAQVSADLYSSVDSRRTLTITRSITTLRGGEAGGGDRNQPVHF